MADEMIHIYTDCKGKTASKDNPIFCADCVDRESKELVYVCPGGEEEYHTDFAGKYSCGTCGALMVRVA